MNPVSRQAAALYLTATFLVGGFAGAAVGYSLGTKPKPFRPDPEAFRQHLMKRYSTELSLTADQQKLLEPLVQQNLGDFDSAHKEHMGRIRECRRKANERIAAILTPEQRAVFERLEREREKGMPKAIVGDGGKK